MLIYEPGSYYILDRGYVDYTRLYKIARHSATFLVRAKSYLRFNRMYSRKCDKSTGIKSDQIGRLSGFYASKQYPEKIRRVKFYDKETNKTFVFLTNNLDITSEQVANLYKNRWQVELIFKWIKQHLKKSILGYIRKCSQDTGVFSTNCILPGSNYWIEA